jgi:hypothetical protein
MRGCLFSQPPHIQQDNPTTPSRDQSNIDQNGLQIPIRSIQIGYKLDQPQNNP